MAVPEPVTFDGVREHNDVLLVVRTTVSAKLLRLVMVMVDVALESVTVILAGFALIVKSVMVKTTLV